MLEHGRRDVGQEQRLLFTERALGQAGRLGRLGRGARDLLGENRPLGPGGARDALQGAVILDDVDGCVVGHPGHQKPHGASRDLALVEGLVNEHGSVVEKCGAACGGFGLRPGARCEGGRDDLPRAHREVLLRAVPVPVRSGVFVAKNPGHAAFHPHRHVQHRADASRAEVALEPARSRIGADVFDRNDSGVQDGGEVLGQVGLEESRTALENPCAGHVTLVAADNGALRVEAPEADAFDLKSLCGELNDVADRGVPVAACGGGELEQRASGVELGRRERPPPECRGAQSPRKAGALASAEARTRLHPSAEARSMPFRAKLPS